MFRNLFSSADVHQLLECPSYYESPKCLHVYQDKRCCLGYCGRSHIYSSRYIYIFYELYMLWTWWHTVYLLLTIWTFLIEPEKFILIYYIIIWLHVLKNVAFFNVQEILRTFRIRLKEPQITSGKLQRLSIRVSSRMLDGIILISWQKNWKIHSSESCKLPFTTIRIFSHRFTKKFYRYWMDSNL